MTVLTKERTILDNKHHSEIFDKMSVNLHQENIKNTELAQKNMKQEE